jgi:hypothetical protein
MKTGLKLMEQYTFYIEFEASECYNIMTSGLRLNISALKLQSLFGSGREHTPVIIGDKYEEDKDNMHDRPCLQQGGHT